MGSVGQKLDMCCPWTSKWTIFLSRHFFWDQVFIRRKVFAEFRALFLFFSAPSCLKFLNSYTHFCHRQWKNFGYDSIFVQPLTATYSAAKHYGKTSKADDTVQSSCPKYIQQIKSLHYCILNLKDRSVFRMRARWQDRLDEGRPWTST